MTAAHEVFAVEFTGGSMRPVVPAGARLECRPAATFAPGDIVVFNAGDQLVAHRVLYSRGQGAELTVVTTSDCRAENDGPQEVQRILGVVTALTYGGKTVDCRRALVRSLFRLLAWSHRWHHRRAAGSPGPAARTHRLLCHLAAGCLWKCLAR